jgi:hypothetical protein
MNKNKLSDFLNLLKNKNKVSVKYACKLLNLNEKELRRYASILRLNWKIPIKYSNIEKVYSLNNNSDSIVYSNEEESLFYVFLNNLLDEKHSETTNCFPFSSANYQQVIKNKIEKNYEFLIDKIYYEASIQEKISPESFHYILKSITQKRQLYFFYINAKGLHSTKVIEPLKILNYMNKWYIVGFCLNQQKIKTFNISRMQQIEITKNNFSNNISNKEIEKYISSSYGIYKDTTTTNVTFRIYEPSYYIVKNQIWHPKQTTKESEKNGKKYIEITLPVGFFDEIIAKINAFLPNVEAVSPITFREEWKKKLIETITRFELSE